MRSITLEDLDHSTSSVSHLEELTKVCKKCRKNYPLSEFSSDITKPDNRDIYCKICRSSKTKIYRHQKEFQKAIRFWREINEDSFYQELDEKYSGFANFQNYIPTPIVTYHFLQYIPKREQFYYTEAFNYLYVWPLIQKDMILTNNFFLAFQDQNHRISKVSQDSKYSSQYVYQGIPAGMFHIKEHLSYIKPYIPVLCFQQICKTCQERKKTYWKWRHARESLNFFDMESPDDLIQLLSAVERYGKVNIALVSHSFSRSYQSATGWSSKCNDCKRKG